MEKINFKKGQKVKFKVVTVHGTFRGKGTIIAGIPKGAMTGAARYTVRGDDDKIRKLFAGQCAAI